MASYNELNALIDAYINRNGVQAITGQILNGVLKAMVEQLGRGYTIMGAATPTTDPGTPDGPECYFASTPGTYTDFDGLQVVPGELALLCYAPGAGWSKETVYEGFQQVTAQADNNVGTPIVGVSYSNGVLSFDFRNIKGNPGDPAGFGQIGADITGGVGTPGVSVESSGPATAKNLQFHFTNLKGETGVTSVLATVDNTSGNPKCTVSLVGQQLTLAFSGLKGAQGDTGSSVDYPFTIVNNLTTDDATQALSAAQGVVLDGKVTQLEAKVGDLSGLETTDNTDLVSAINENAEKVKKIETGGGAYPAESIDFGDDEADPSLSITNDGIKVKKILGFDGRSKDYNPLIGRKWVVCGDSFTAGAFSGSTDPYIFTDEPYKGMEMTYPFFIARRTGVVLHRICSGGMTISDVNTTLPTNSFTNHRGGDELYKRIPADADIVTLWFGINDKGYDAPIGTIDSVDITTFYGAWNVVLQWIINNRPQTKIGIIITTSMSAVDMSSYTEAERNIAKKYGVPFLDLQKDVRIPYYLWQNEREDVADSVKTARNSFYVVSNSNPHPNAKCHEFQSWFIEEWLKTL